MRPYVFVVALAGFASSARAACDTLLSQGVYDELRLSTSSFSKSAFHSSLCSATEERIDQIAKDGGGGQGGVDVLGIVKVSLGGGGESFREFARTYRSSFCTANASANENDDRLSRAQRVISPALMSAYVECRKLEKAGLDFTVIGQDETSLTLTISSQPNMVAIKLNSIQVSPKGTATCSTTVPEGTTIKGNTVATILCERAQGNTAAYSVTVSTVAGAYRVSVPGFQAMSSTEKFMSGFARGTILPWAGGAVPRGWAICDGSNGTPDLRGRFLRGTPDKEKTGATGGSDSHSHKASGKTPDSGRKGSDLHWGDTPWKDGPNPTMAGQTLSVEVADASNLPPHVNIQFILRL